jgi:multidrug efflux pump subunit AcrB
MAFLGIVSLAGIVVRNAIVLIDYANQARKNGADAAEAVRQAGERRLRPILLTTLAALVGMTPMLLSGSTLWVPIASAIAAGLLGSTLLTLAAIPVLVVGP